MAYEKRTWVSGVTKCSAENFNHMEDGIETAQKGVDELNTKLTNGFVGGASSGTTNINIDSSNSNYLIVVCTGDDFSVCVASRYAGTIKFCILKDHSAVTYAQLDGRLIGINCSSAYNYSLTKLCHMIS
nr:MAG TPA: hypothetical protein [Caudoviricetes sp.]